MSLVPWRPSLFDDFDKFFESEDWFLPVVPRAKMFEPAMDLYETDREFIAELNLPGIDPDKVEVSVANGVLSVRGSREEKKEEKGKGYLRRERSYGVFQRAVRLDSPVKEDKVEASYDNGVLKIVMPKAEEAKEKKVKVKVKTAGK